MHERVLNINDDQAGIRPGRFFLLALFSETTREDYRYPDNLRQEKLLEQ